MNGKAKRTVLQGRIKAKMQAKEGGECRTIVGNKGLNIEKRKIK